MSKFIPGPYLDGKVEIEFDQGDERERYEAARAARDGPYPEGADPGSDGYCTTASLYWIKTHRNLRMTPREGSEKGARGRLLRGLVTHEVGAQRDMLYSLHDSANRRMEEASKALAHATAKAAQKQSKIDELTTQLVRLAALRNAKNNCNATLAARAEGELAERIRQKQRKLNQLLGGIEEEDADRLRKVGDAEIEGVYADVAEHFDLKFAGGQRKPYAPATIGAEVKGALFRSEPRHVQVHDPR
jgi:hypothetical protein